MEAGLYDEAIAAKREAIAAGYRSVPDPEADIAECLLDAGEIDEADALFATLRERDPEDVWLFNAAAYSYAGFDVAESLRWALDGIEVALATGDPNQVVMQLLEAAEAAWGDWAEKLATVAAGALGLPAATIELAVRDDQTGIISRFLLVDEVGTREPRSSTTATNSSQAARTFAFEIVRLNRERLLDACWTR